MKNFEERERQTREQTDFEVKDNTLVIHVNGELDHHNAVFIRSIADEKIYKNQIKNVIFDFEKTGFMDSSGIGVIMGRYRMVNSLGGIVCVTNVKNNVDKILLFSGLNKIVRKYVNVETAINDISGGIING